MSPRGGSQDWLYQELTSLRQLVMEQHARQRAEMQTLFSELRHDMQEHQEFDDETRRMIERVITQREEEEKLAVKKTTWIAMIVSGGGLIISEILKKAWK